MSALAPFPATVDRIESDGLKVVGGAAAGTWIRPRLEEKCGAVAIQIPQGIGAYTRV